MNFTREPEFKVNDRVMVKTDEGLRAGTIGLVEPGLAVSHYLIRLDTPMSDGSWIFCASEFKVTRA